MTAGIAAQIGIEAIGKFIKYFQDTYLNGQFPVIMWNHFDNNHDRTDNRVEGDNNKMKSFCWATNLSINKAIAKLQQ